MVFPTSFTFNDEEYGHYAHTGLSKAKEHLNKNDLYSFSRNMEDYVLDAAEVKELATLILMTNFLTAHKFMTELLAAQIPTINDQRAVDALFKTIQESIESDPELKDKANLRMVLGYARNNWVL
jgi:hypothetical protein